jgi:glycosyltransferase involved in cell wall biosynthesis
MQASSLPTPGPADAHDGRPQFSVVIPAHNEAAVLGRCLATLLDRLGPAEVVVVANGCSDGTAAVGRTFPGVRVIELTQASKTEALNAGDTAVEAFPRIYLDADIRMSGTAACWLAAELDQERPLMAAPKIEFDVERSSWTVRAFYRAYRHLPYASVGLSGRGVYGLSEAGRRRFDEFPAVTADDLFVQGRFVDHERRQTDGVSRIATPRDYRNLVRVRTRTVMGNRELTELGLHHCSGGSTVRAAVLLMWRRPSTVLDVAVFLAVGLHARVAARFTGHRTWLRDESSRHL